MPSWRDAVLQHFQTPTHHLILVADPDGLLQEEQVLAVVRARGFDVMPFEDPIAFRYAYESQYRSRWDAGEETPLALVVRTSRPDLRHLPYDLLQRGRHLAFSLHDLLPRLNYPVVRDFFRAAPALFDRLMEAHLTYEGSRLGEQRTLAFIARHVYNLDPVSLTTLDDLVERLLTVYYHGWPLPERLQRWLWERLQASPTFRDLPVDRWLADRGFFFTFVEAQWQAYIRARGLTLAEHRPIYDVGTLQRCPEPVEGVDFNRLDIRLLVDTLFLEGKLRPAHVIAERPPEDWTAIGVTVDAEAYRQNRLARLLDHITDQMPGADTGHRAWLELAPTWAEALVLAHQTPLSSDLDEQFAAVRQRLTESFSAWVQARYDALHTLPYLPAPVVGHHVAHFLAHRLRQGATRLALIVVDGLALDQWYVIREVWQVRPWSYDEQVLFAGLPTVTPIARQALFAGQLPLYFPDTWQRTDADGRRWRRFWEDQGLLPSTVAWLRGPEDGSTGLTTGLEAVLSDKRVRVLGLVISTVDEMLHGTVQGLGELHDRVRRWAEQGTLAEVIERLLMSGFDVWLTSDHGNVAAEGIGRPREGVLVERRGTRVRFYTDPAFLERARAEVPDALAWTPAGLPSGLLTLFAPDRRAFANTGEWLVTHGGLTLEEVIVPWIHMTQEEEHS
jgi:hypothetical protein